MNQFNLSQDLSPDSVEQSYANGLLPQRNQKGLFYDSSSCRSDLDNFVLSSENRRILNKTSDFTFKSISVTDFKFNIEVQKTIFHWLKGLGWDFPISSVKSIFTDHIFNRIYVWQKDNRDCAYSICYFSKNISHIAYVFYDPKYSHSDLPIRLVLQFIIDSHQNNLKYAYLGRFDPSLKVGYYKRTMPGFEYYENKQWTKYQK